jgi:xanthine dehydrogenase accessory factor
VPKDVKDLSVLWDLIVRVIVRGIGDVGSAVAHKLFVVGHSVIIHDDPKPATTRRSMAFADAIFDGQAVLNEVTAIRIDDLDALPEVLAGRIAVPVVVSDFVQLVRVTSPDALIDARMRKRHRPEVQRGLAPLTIGLGPNFVVGETADSVVETSREQLGQILTRASSLPLRGEPRAIAAPCFT